MIDAKAYLQQIKLCDEYISSKLAEAERLKALAMTNKDYVSILYKRYFEHKTWEKIACETNYS